MYKLITNLEDQTDSGHTRGWIVPAETPADADLELEAVEHVDIPATEDEADWDRGLRAALAGAGFALDGEIILDGGLAIASVTRN